MIVLKTAHEIEMIRRAGRVLADAHRLARDMLAPGVTTLDIDRAVERLFKQRGAVSLFKGAAGEVPYPAVTCISVNEQVVHGIPGPYRIREGDIVSVDTGCRLDGWCADAAWTYAVGRVDSLRAGLLEAGQSALETAIREMHRATMWSQVARVFRDLVESSGFRLIEEFVGHGIGREMHEDPQVPSVVDEDDPQADFSLQPGLVLAVEPIVAAGTGEVVLCEDHWTVETDDGSPAVHFEHCVALTADGPLVLTAGVGGRGNP